MRFAEIVDAEGALLYLDEDIVFFYFSSIHYPRFNLERVAMMEAHWVWARGGGECRALDPSYPCMPSAIWARGVFY